MNRYVLTPGQSDIVRGTYTPEFMNRNVIAVAVQAPLNLSREQIDKALTDMKRNHPALRSALTGIHEVASYRQEIHPETDDTVSPLFLQEAAALEGELSTLMSALVHQMAADLDVTTGSTWGVIQLRATSVDHLVFVFNHVMCDFVSVSQFIKTFARSCMQNRSSVGARDTYIDYLRDLEAAWADKPDAPTSWWLNRPWDGIPALPGLSENTSPHLSEPKRWNSILHEREVRAPQLTEALLIRTVERSLREVTGVRSTRVDAAVNGRYTKAERLANGWISHALPYFQGAHPQSDSIAVTRNNGPRWPVAFSFVRDRLDLSLDDHLSAHAFVNFFGSSDIRRTSFAGFRLSPSQPVYEPPRRASLTPLHLKVRKQADHWDFSWSLSPRFSDNGMPRAIADRVVDSLR